MRIEDVRYVLAVAEEENLTRAAARMHVTPPTMSEAIKRVEAFLGLEIFERSNRGMQLTNAGRRVLPEIQAVATAAASLEESSRKVGAVAERLRVGTMLGYGSSVLQELIEQPPVLPGGKHLRIEMSVFDWNDPTACLKSGKTDVAILVGPTLFDSNLESSHLGDEPRVVVVAASNPLADRDSMSLAELDQIGWLPVRSADHVWESFMYCEPERGGPAPLVRRSTCNTPQDLALALHNGEGAMTAPLDLAQHFSMGRDVFLPLRGVKGFPIRICHPSNGGSAGIDLVRSMLRTRLPPVEGLSALAWSAKA